MYVFMDSTICKKDLSSDVRIHTNPKGNADLLIPCYSGNLQRPDFLHFIFPCSKIELQSGFFQNNLILRETKKTFNFIPSKNTKAPEEDFLYTLVRSTQWSMDDVFIPAFMKEKVEVLKRIRFLNGANTSDAFFSNMYFIKIHLEKGEKIPLYLSFVNTLILNSYHLVSRTESGYAVVPWCQKDAFPIVDKAHISLSKLC